MAVSNGDGSAVVREGWEEEVFFNHRWGWDRDRAADEHARLKELWEHAQPLDPPCKKIVDQIVALEICNWNLEESILALCSAIGAKQPARFAIGHMEAVSEERWKKIWAYYLACRDWLPKGIPSGYGAMLASCDPDAEVQRHVRGQLGETNELKQLYVELFCLSLEFWIGGLYEMQSSQTLSRDAAVGAVRREIKKRDPEGKMLWSFAPEGSGVLFPCHHKLFRRYDIILSSIGVRKWRGAIPMRGTDGYQRADTVERFLSPIEAWLNVPRTTSHREGDELLSKIHASLEQPDPVKVFLASLLVSLLRSQQFAARKQAEKRAKKP